MKTKNNMAKRLIFATIFFTLSLFSASAAEAFQLENAGFEDWSSTTLPVGWNTYETAQGKFATTAQSSEQCKQGSGHSGNYSVCAVGRKIFGTIIGNGIVTSGVINAGAMSATDESNNNQTVKDDDAKNMRFAGRPDSVVAWIKAVPKTSSQLGRFYVMLHDNNNLQDPGTTWANVIAVAGLNPPSSSQWVRYSCPFYYAGETHNIVSENGNSRIPGRVLADGERPTFALVTISTNYLAGKGTAGDEIYCDDIEMIYNSELTSLSFDGKSISGFAKDKYSYQIEGSYTSGSVTYTSNGRYATVEESYNESTKVLTLTVKGDNYSEDNSNKHVYTLSFVCSSQLNGFEVAGSPLADFSSDKLEYTIDEVYEEVKSTISYSVASCAKVTESWDETSNILTITVDADEQKVYKFQFHAPYQSYLTDLKVNGTSISGFSSTTYSYSSAKVYTDGVTKIAYTASEEATVTTAFDSKTLVYTLTVRGGNYAKDKTNTHTYTIQFHAPYNSYLTDLKVNGSSISDFSSTKYAYTTKKVYVDGETKVTYSASDEASVETAFDDKTLIYSLVVKGGDYADNNENIHSYTLQFHAPYGAQLTSFAIDGEKISGFASDVYEYSLDNTYDENSWSVTLDEEATYDYSFSEAEQLLTITVKGGDYDENPDNVNVYKIYYHAPYESFLTDLRIDGVTLTDFSKTNYSYSTAKVYTDGVTKVTYTASEEATVEASFDSKTLVYTFVVKGGDVADNAGNVHTYKLQFHAPYGSQLSSVVIDGEALSGFAPDVYSYTVPNNYVKSQLELTADAEATIETSFDKSTYLLTITVKGGDYAENSSNIKTYKIQYHAPYESYLTDLKIDGVSIPNFSSTKYTYSVANVFVKGTTDITYEKSDDAVVEVAYDSTTLAYTLVVKSGNFAEDSDNTHTYVIKFHEAYGSLLQSLSINKVALPDFSSEKFDYRVEESYQEGKVTYDADDDATATHSFDAATNLLTIVVKGGDYASNPSNVHSYTIQFCASSFLTDLTYSGVTVPTFRSDKYNYDLSSYSYEAAKVAYTFSEGATVKESYDAESSVLTIVVSGSDLDLYPNNIHTYTLQFHASYGSCLTSLSVDGELIEGFSKSKYDYLITGSYDEYEDRLTYTADAEARVKTSFNDETNLLTLVVSGADIATNPANTHTYTIQFYAPSSLTTLKVNGINVAGFAPTKYEYSLNTIVYETARILYYAESGTTVEESFDSSTQILSITVKGSDIATYPDNYKTYQLQFGKPLGSQLLELTINGIAVEAFDKNKYDYISNEFYSEGIVEYRADSAATVTLSYDKKNFVLTLRVEAGDYASNATNFHVYTIAFADPTYYGSQLLDLTFNGVTADGFSKEVYEYFVDGSYSDIKVRYSTDDLATVVETFDAESNSLILTVNGGNIAKDSSNYHTYTIKFSSTFVFEAYLTSLIIGGEKNPSFDKDKFNFKIDADYAASDIAYEVSPLAQYCADYNKSTGVLTVVVWAGNFDKNATNFNTYKITFK